jgi:hypothetical protein
MQMEFEESKGLANSSAEGKQQQPLPMPPPFVLTAETNLIHLQKQLNGLDKGNFEFRNTRDGTINITKQMTDF